MDSQTQATEAKQTCGREGSLAPSVKQEHQGTPQSTEEHSGTSTLAAQIVNPAAFSPESHQRASLPAFYDSRRYSLLNISGELHPEELAIYKLLQEFLDLPTQDLVREV